MIKESGICWYCHWGWPKQVADIYDKYAAMCNGNEFSILDYGPSHIVWADENFETEHIQWCIDTAEEWNKHEWDAKWPDCMKHDGPTLSPEQLKIAVDSLKELITIPEEIRLCRPDDYDEEHPENYPPPKGLEMVKR